METRVFEEVRREKNSTAQNECEYSVFRRSWTFRAIAVYGYLKRRALGYSSCGWFWEGPSKWPCRSQIEDDWGLNARIRGVKFQKLVFYQQALILVFSIWFFPSASDFYRQKYIWTLIHYSAHSMFSLVTSALSSSYTLFTRVSRMGRVRDELSQCILTS